jgi:hypothetical protein
MSRVAGSPALISYRRRGGMTGLDQRLTLYADGRAVLDDRRSRARTEVHATPREAERVAALIDEVPAELWHGRLGTVARALLPHPREGMRFELRAGSRWIVGVAGHAEAHLAPLLAQLDELLAGAVREGRSSA